MLTKLFACVLFSTLVVAQPPKSEADTPAQDDHWLVPFQTAEEKQARPTVLGSYCFGYTPGSSDPVGQVHLRMELPVGSNSSGLETLELLLFDNQKDSWDVYNQLPSDANCKARRETAKRPSNGGKEYTLAKVTFNKVTEKINGTDQDVYQWFLPDGVTASDSNAARNWILVLQHCKGDAILPIPKILYDLRFTALRGMYDQDQGPHRCTPPPSSWDEEHQTGLIVGIIIFVLLDVALVFFLYRKCKGGTSGGGMCGDICVRRNMGHQAVAQQDDFEPDELALDDVGMLRDSTLRSDD